MDTDNILLKEYIPWKEKGWCLVKVIECQLPSFGVISTAYNFYLINLYIYIPWRDRC